MLVFSLWPVAVHLLLAFHEGTQAGIVDFLVRHKVTLVVVGWALQVLGLIVALILAPWRKMLAP